MGFDSDLRSLIQSMPRTGGAGGAAPAGHSGAGSLADASEETTFLHAAKVEQRLQMRKLQLQTRGLSDAGASQVVAGAPPGNAVDELMVSRALGKPPSPGV